MALVAELKFWMVQAKWVSIWQKLLLMLTDFPIKIKSKRSNMDKTTGIGYKLWAIAEGYIPGWSNGPLPQMQSHESLCFLNTSDSDATVFLYIYHTDREPSGPFTIIVPARRTLHQRLNELENPEIISHGKEFACYIESDVPVVVQHTRLDSRQSRNALISTIAFHNG
jgi:hypothetical protein